MDEAKATAAKALAEEALKNVKNDIDIAMAQSEFAIMAATDCGRAARNWFWKAIAEGRSGLLHATTGAGKTYAVWLGALMSFMPLAQLVRAQAAIKNIANKGKAKAAPLTVLWITPMRALAADTLRAAAAAAGGLEFHRQ